MASIEAVKDRILTLLEGHQAYDAKTIATRVGADLGDVRRALFEMLIDERVVEEDAPAAAGGRVWRRTSGHS